MAYPYQFVFVFVFIDKNACCTQTVHMAPLPTGGHASKGEAAEVVAARRWTGRKS